MSATDGLLDLHEQIEKGSAFAQAGRARAARRGVFPARRRASLYRQDRGPDRSSDAR
jgi:hypothetical protein